MANQIKKLNTGFETAFIDGSVVSDLAFRPQFLSNDYRQGRKVLTSIEDELLGCDRFYISVAFITLSGIEPLLQTLKELEQKGIPGQILTTDYLNFSQPKALRKLNELSNIELRMYRTEGSNNGFHTKGYIFQNDGLFRIIIGSSNLTANALAVNKEWNTKILSTEQGEFSQQVLKEFESFWNSDKAKVFDEFIETYTIEYQTTKEQQKNAIPFAVPVSVQPQFDDFIASYEVEAKAIAEQKKIAAHESVPSIEQYSLRPNSMQVEFIRSLHDLIENGKNKALLISATGTGKTYASAFGLRNEKPNKILFIVHREQIAKQALDSYKKVFGSSGSYGLISGSHRNFDSMFVFSTMQMMAKEIVRKKFSPNEFDYIVIDEVHRAGAESYQRIMDYFEPKLWLGMTASPERPDGYDIYSLFDHNIAYEIRLQQALEEDLLCPFHYFGITDITVDGELIDEKRDFKYLVSDDRVEHVIREAEYYGYSGDRVKGLVFCSRKEEAKELSLKFNAKGYRTEFICGDDSQEKRENCIDRLTKDEGMDQLDYIFTIDIFNEGVDIPEINQVIMLRPTQSPIIFVQQLGRGLRKADDKEFVVILDFIGNYDNNFMIPIALSGDRSYNKDNMRRYVSGGTRTIPGSSSIHFDEIARKQIYEAIDRARTNDLKLLKDSYRNLKYKLGRIPSIGEFAVHDSIDAMKFIDKCGSYYMFLKKYEPDYTIRFSEDKESVLEYISTKLATGKRVHELVLLDIIMAHNDKIKERFKKKMHDRYSVKLSAEEFRSLIDNVTNQFGKETEKKKYKSCIFITAKDGKLRIAPGFEEMLKDEDFFYTVAELVSFGIDRYEKWYSESYKDTNLVLYQKYTYEDVCRLLNWKTNMNAQNIGGYFYDKDTKTLPVFINYDKADDAIAYEDRFISNGELIALSKHPRKIDSTDADHFYKRTESDKDNKIYLFVRKNKDDKEAKEFYFLGELFAVGEPEQIQMVTPDGKKDNAFEITYRLETPVRDDIYNYIAGD